MEIGELIKEARKEAGLSQKALADSLGISQQNIAQWESGKRNPKINSLLKIAFAIGLPYTAFLPAIERSYKYTKIENIMDDLNTTGQEKVIDYAEDLSKIPEYQAAASPDIEKDPRI